MRRERERGTTTRASPDLLNRDGILALAPSVVVRRGADERVRELGLTGELGLREGGHVLRDCPVNVS